jgi:cell wall-associated NlpC family hydrolase
VTCRPHLVSLRIARPGNKYPAPVNGPANGDRGFDCSGLTKAAYFAAGIRLPRTAQTQYNAGPRVPVDRLEPGDLVFFGSSTTHVTHVGLALSATKMINAPDFGELVGIDQIGARALGATRPMP